MSPTSFELILVTSFSLPMIGSACRPWPITKIRSGKEVVKQTKLVQSDWSKGFSSMVPGKEGHSLPLDGAESRLPMLLHLVSWQWRKQAWGQHPRKGGQSKSIKRKGAWALMVLHSEASWPLNFLLFEVNMMIILVSLVQIFSCLELKASWPR